MESYTSLQDNEFSAEQTLLFLHYYTDHIAFINCVMSHRVEKLHSGHRLNILYTQFTVLLHFFHQYAAYVNDYGSERRPHVITYCQNCGLL